MQVKNQKYDKWYCNKKLRNIVDVKISEIVDEKDIRKLYNIFNEVLKSEYLLLDFSNSHGFEDENIISENIEYIKKKFFNNKGNLDFIYMIDMSRLYGVAQIQKEKVDDSIFKKLCNTFEGITFYNSNSKVDYDNLKQLLKFNKNICTHEYLIINDLVDLSFTYFNDDGFAYIRINSSKINAGEIISKIKTIINTN